MHGKPCVYYDGYWIRYYAPPDSTLLAKKRLIDSLTKRVFHHTETGINTPGENLELARQAYEGEADPRRKRVNGAMLAGALFNRATDILTTIVDLEAKGVKTAPDDELMQRCSAYLQEAMDLGKLVKHLSGQEEIEELWGEPFKAFVMSIDAFYESRYTKIAQAMRDIDITTDKLRHTFEGDKAFVGLASRITRFGKAAKNESETLRRDPVIFEVWPRFVAAAEELETFEPSVSSNVSDSRRQEIEKGRQLIREGTALITYLASARVPMPKSTRDFLRNCDAYRCSRGDVVPPDTGTVTAP